MSRTPLWTAADAAAATGGRARGAACAGWVADGVSIDSRTLVPGDLFVALAGPDHDGHQFVAAALAKGAAAAVVSAVPAGTAATAPLLVVRDTLEALAALGRAARARSPARIVAVTGSAGKTGTKEALRHALSAQGPTAASAASHNNHWGVPLSLARMAEDCVYGVFEIGMNHPGEIAPLSRMVRPSVAVITNVEAAHTAFFDTIEAVADAKAEIFEGLAPGGTAVLNRDSPHFDRLARAAQRRPDAAILSFGFSGDADVRAVRFDLQDRGSDVSAEVRGTAIDYRIGIPGRHWVANSLAVIAAAGALGADVARAAASLAGLSPLEGRGKAHTVPCAGGSFVLIDESYNANPASVHAAIETLGRMAPGKGGRRIAVLGTMRELGPDSDRLHADLAEPLVESGIDLVLAAGDMRLMFDRLPAGMRGASADTGEALAEAAAASVRAGDVVMVKGSNASRMGTVVRRLLEAVRDAASAR